jgi:hypothetical protein
MISIYFSNTFSIIQDRIFSYDFQDSSISSRKLNDRESWISKPNMLLSLPQEIEYKSSLCASPKSNYRDLFVACIATLQGKLNPFDMVCVWNAGATSSAFKDAEGKIAVSFKSTFREETPSALVFSSTNANIILIGTVQG